jgi:EAL domain-containing protein (putative c-di-GMP-specific phosphodiesterase class I)
VLCLRKGHPARSPPSSVCFIQQNTGAIALSIVTLSKALGVPVIAEGAESAVHRRFLLDAGCVEAQGFLYGRPVDKQTIASMLAAAG